MLCSNCGKEISGDTKFCPNCGKSLLNSDSNQGHVYKNMEEKANIWLAILSFFIPLVGLIIFITKKDKEPKTAKASGICALISFGLKSLIAIILFGITFTNIFVGANKIQNEVKDIINDAHDTISDISETNLDSENSNKEVSSNWLNYEVVVNNKSIKLPCTYLELTNLTGFKMKSSDENSMLSSNYYALVNMYKNDKLALYAEILNDTNGDLKYTDGKITKVGQTKYQVSNGSDVFTFPGGIKVGDVITENEIISKYGEPNKKNNYSSNNYESVTYRYNENTNWTTTNYFEIKIVNGVVDEITLDKRN